MASTGVLAQTTTPPPPPTNLPPVRAILGDVLCYGSRCAEVLDAIIIEMQLVYTDVSISDLGVDHGRFCSDLNANKPAGCSLTAVPHAPGITTGWQPNGCGPADPSAFLSATMYIAEQIELIPGYTGNRDEPIAGTSFLNACNRHDQCYGYAFDKGGCDITFLENMMSDCVYSSNRSSCEAAASIYHVAVNAYGQSSYDKSVADRTCATWAFDMTNNGCT